MTIQPILHRKYPIKPLKFNPVAAALSSAMHLRALFSATLKAEMLRPLLDNFQLPSQFTES
jgi:hypothetical protein